MSDILQQLPKLLDYYDMPPSMGRVFFVDPVNGAAGNNGAAPDSALDTTAAAVALCTADHNDIIIRMPGVERPGDVGLALNVRGITIIGVAWNNPFQQEETAYWREVALGANTATGPAVEITQACTIIGMEFMAASTIALSGSRWMSAIMINGNGGGYNAGFCQIKRCRFPGWGLQGVGICLRGTGYNIIEECTFEECGEAGIMLESDVNNDNFNYIKKCNFLGCTNAGIDTPATGTPKDTQVIVNRFVRTRDTAQTLGIRTRAQWGGGFIKDNYFGYTRAGVLAIDQNRAALEAIDVYCAGNQYTDGQDPRA
jgi:parallel beta-helix repeat protein